MRQMVSRQDDARDLNALSDRAGNRIEWLGPLLAMPSVYETRP